MNTSRKGDLLEMKVMVRLFEAGLDIALPFGVQKGWDILAEVDGGWKKIQIKTAKLRGKDKTRVYVDFLRSKDRINNAKSGEWEYKGYSRDEVDFICAVEPKTFRMWIIPVEVIEGKRSLTFGFFTSEYDWPW